MAVAAEIKEHMDVISSVRKTVGKVDHMDGPDNPKPTTYSTRPYGRVGAFFTADTAPEQPLHLLYRLVLWEGDKPTPDELAAAYYSFVTPVTVKP